VPRVTTVSLCLIVAFAVALQAQTDHIALYSDAQFSDPHLGTEGTGLVSIYVVARSTTPLTAVQYWAPIPDCWQGATWIGDVNMFPITIGSSQTGISIGLGGCVTTPVHLQTINVIATVPPPNDICCLMVTRPDLRAPSGEIEFVDCNSLKFFGSEAYAIVGDGSAPPAVINRLPADQSGDQPLDVFLQWHTLACGGTSYNHTVYFGTTPDPPAVAYDLETENYDPGPLYPNTTYYWKIFAWPLGPGGSTTTPVWSFTTSGGVPVGQTTWGAIKALFD
jgi:hypothetical protein